MSALFDEYSSSSSSSDDEKNKKDEVNYEMDFIPKSNPTLIIHRSNIIYRETLRSSIRGGC